MKLVFSKRIYRSEAVRKAKEAYSDTADLDLRETGVSIKVQIKKVKKGERQRLADEFCNYAIACMQELND